MSLKRKFQYVYTISSAVIAAALVLGILLSLMIIMAGVQNNGIFDEIGRRLLAHTKNTAQLAFVLVFLCFFFSMVITNDVALLTFVPFALLTLQ